MKFTPREVAASQVLAAALLELAAAVEEGRASRRADEAARMPQRPPTPPKAGPPEKILLTSREAAAMLSISERTLYDMRAPKGPIPAVFLGTAVRYQMDELRKALGQLQTKAAPPTSD